MEVHLRQAGDRAEQHVLDARLAGRRDRDGVAVAAQSLRDPQDVDLLDAGGFCGHSSSIVTLRLLQLERVDEQLLAAHHLHVQAPARARRPAGTPSQLALASRSAADAGRGYVLDGQLGAVQRPCPAATSSKANASASGTTWRRCPTRSSTASTRRPPACAPAIARLRRRSRARASADPRERVADQLVHHALAAEARSRPAPCPAARSSPRRSRRPLAAGHARSAASARRPPRGDEATTCPRWRRTSGRCPGSRRRRRRRARPAPPPRARASRRRRRAPAR